MEEIKKTNRTKQQKEANGGLFQLFSDVATASKAAFKEVQANEAKNKKPPMAEGISRAAKDCTNFSSRATGSKLSNTAPKSAPEPQTKESTRRSTCLLPGLLPTVMVDMAKDVISPPAVVLPDNDWELLSSEDRSSSKNSNGSFVACPRAGSVRSIASLEQERSSQTELSVPFKIQRTNSSSTLDSQDNAIGPSGKGVLGVDYVEHVVLPTDTLQGICIAYKVSASHLRRANHFTGALHSAPKKLVVPLSKKALRTGFIRIQDTDTKEYKLQYFQSECPGICIAEAKAYLELADWELKDAIQSAKEDKEWESENEGGNDHEQFDRITQDDKERRRFKSGQIGIKVDFRGGIPIFNIKGTGIPSLLKTNQISSDEESSSSCDVCRMEDEGKTKKEKVVIHKRLPAIATKSVMTEDLYNAAPQHEAFGFELQTIPKRDLEKYSEVSAVKHDAFYQI